MVGSLQTLRELLVDLRNLLVMFMPGPTGNRMRTRFYRSRLRSLGDNVIIDVGVHFINPSYISIGDNCWIDKYAVVMAGPPHKGQRKITRTLNPLFEHEEGAVVVGSNCHIGSHVVLNGHGGVAVGKNATIAAGAKIISLSHHHQNLSDPADMFPYRFGSMAPEHEQALISSPVVMRDNSALATNAIMLPGSTVGFESWVGANSLVTGTIPDGYLAWGVPARPVKRRGAASDATAPPIVDRRPN
jgi:acetyltransferase-like isoleucine patch superfamily enzyme